VRPLLLTRGADDSEDEGMAEQNAWAAYGIVKSLRDGRPILTETSLWQLERDHPELVEREAGAVAYVHLDQPYRVERLADRAYCELIPAPGRRRAKAG
jgi:hypothetical protein